MVVQAGPAGGFGGALAVAINPVPLGLFQGEIAFVLGHDILPRGGAVFVYRQDSITDAAAFRCPWPHKMTAR
ncbi:hypothetical protein GCM10009099_15830 [Caenispirillum bisanense]